MNRISRDASRASAAHASAQAAQQAQAAAEEEDAGAEDFMAMLMNLTQPVLPQANASSDAGQAPEDNGESTDDATDAVPALSLAAASAATDEGSVDPEVVTAEMGAPAAAEVAAIAVPSELVSADDAVMQQLSEQANAVATPGDLTSGRQAVAVTTVTDRATPVVEFHPDVLEKLLAHHLHQQELPVPKESVTRLGADDAAASQDALEALPDVDASLEPSDEDAMAVDDATDPIDATASAKSADIDVAAATDADGAAAWTGTHDGGSTHAGATETAATPPPVFVPMSWSALQAPQVRMQVSAQVANALRESSHEIELQLDPPEWGHVRLHLSVEHDEVTVRVHAEHDFVKSALDGSVVELRKALAEQGLQLTSMQVDVGSGGASNWASYAAQHELLATGRRAGMDVDDATDVSSVVPLPVRAKDPRASTVDALA